MTELADCILGETSFPIDVTTKEANGVAAQALVRQAKRSLYIHSRDLDHTVYDNRLFVEAVKNLATSSRFATVRILIQDSRKVVNTGHRLVDLAYRLSTAIKIRKPDAQFRDFNGAFLVVDDVGYLHRRVADRYEGIVNFNGPDKVAELIKYFRLVWEKSQPDPRIRRLSI